MNEDRQMDRQTDAPAANAPAAIEARGGGRIDQRRKKIEYLPQINTTMFIAKLGFISAALMSARIW